MKILDWAAADGPAGLRRVRTVHRPSASGGDDVDVASAAALDFCRDVLDEVMELFPVPHVGIGGDECPGDPRSSAAFVTALAEHVLGRGRVPDAWDEILECGGVSGVEYRPAAGPHPWQSRPDAPGRPISKARREAMVAEFGIGGLQP